MFRNFEAGHSYPRKMDTSRCLKQKNNGNFFKSEIKYIKRSIFRRKEQIW